MLRLLLCSHTVLKTFWLLLFVLPAGANHSISKLFLDCHTQLKEFRQLQSEETAALEKE